MKRSFADDVDDTIRHMQYLEFRPLPLSICTLGQLPDDQVGHSSPTLEFRR